MSKPLTVWIIINCGMLLKRCKYHTILPVSWETCIEKPVKKQQLEPCMEQLTGSRLRKEYDRAVCCHSVCLIYTLSKSWEMPWLDELQAGIKTGRRNINSFRYADNTILIAESERNWRASWWKWKRRMKEECGLKLNIQKTKIMLSGPTTSWQIDGETMETMTNFIFGGLQNPCRWLLQPWN